MTGALETYIGMGPVRDDNDFNWPDNAELIVVPERQQQAIAVYENVRGATVIRQEGDWSHHEDDPVIVVLPEHLAALIEALQIRLIESGLGDPILDRPESVTAKTVTTARDATGASRSRRYRQRKKQPTGRGGVAELLPLAAE